MKLEIFNCPQGSTEWIACRLGIPTASEFQTIIAKGRGGGESVGRRTYMYKLAGEIITQQPMWSYSNEHMERGKEMEAEARDLYAMVSDVEPVQVGFLRQGGMGASPDSLIGDSGLLEIKTKLPHLQIECLVDEVLPNEHKAQCQGQLLVSGRQWVDFCSYWPGLPLFRVRVHRDEQYIAMLKIAIENFNEELGRLVDRIQNYTQRAAA